MNQKRVVLLALVFLVIFTSIFFVVLDYRAKNKYVPFYEYYETIEPGSMVISMEGRLIQTETPRYIDGVVYYSYQFIKEFVDKYIFWEEDLNRLTITTDNNIFKYRIQVKERIVNYDRKEAIPYPVLMIGGVIYIPENIVYEKYSLITEYNPESEAKIVVVTDEYSGKDSKTGTAKGNIRLRYKSGNKSAIYAKIKSGEMLTIFDEENGDFIKVRTKDGVTGFVLKKELENIVTEPGKFKTEQKYQHPKIGDSDKIVMAWQVFGSKEASGMTANQVTEKGLHVLSPTWFSFDEENLDGTIISLANKDYSDWAHSQGLQVWGLITDNFKKEVSHAILTKHREYVIKQLLEFVDLYDMDGINIDFEALQQEDAPYYIQFFRELYPLLKAKGKILSVDTYVPSPWSTYYSRGDVAQSVDFVIIMAYDEHWSTSPVAGPNASISFVDDGLRNTLLEVPKEKIILGIPFYVRAWEEKEQSDGQISVTSRSYSMERAYSTFRQKGVNFEWVTKLLR